MVVSSRRDLHSSVLPQQLAAQLLDAEVAGTPEFENQRFLFGEHVLLHHVVWTPALVVQSSDTIGLVPAPPLPQRRPRNATPAANHAGVAKLLVKLRTQPRRVFASMRSPATSGWLWI